MAMDDRLTKADVERIRDYVTRFPGDEVSAQHLLASWDRLRDALYQIVTRSDYSRTKGFRASLDGLLQEGQE